MSKMKTSTTRVVPIVKDLEQQFIEHPTSDRVFMYDDGGVFRAFAVTAAHVGDNYVIASINDQHVVTIPSDTPWRLVSRDCIDLRTGKEVETARMHGLYEEHALKEELMKKLEGDKSQKSKKTKADEKKAPTPGMYL